jgi:hypothetical protein
MRWGRAFREERRLEIAVGQRRRCEHRTPGSGKPVKCEFDHANVGHSFGNGSIPGCYARESIIEAFAASALAG